LSFFLDGGITFWGNDFFWTMGKPIAEFEASVEAFNLARMEWFSFIESGKLSQRQINAAVANNSAGFLEAPRTN
jgi:hypothetical protein